MNALSSKIYSGFRGVKDFAVSAYRFTASTVTAGKNITVVGYRTIAGSVSAKTQFADTHLLATRFQSNQVEINPGFDHNAVLDRMVAAGTLRSKFREQIVTIDQIQDHMLSRGITREKLDRLDCVQIQPYGTVDFSIDSLYQNKQALLSRIVPAIVNGAQSVTIGDAKMALNYAIGITTAISVAYVFGGVGLAAMSLLGAATSHYSGRTPHTGSASTWGNMARYYSRTIAPWAYIGGAGYVSYEIFQSNMQIPSFLSSLGMKGGAVVAAIAGGSFLHFVGKNLHEVDQSYPAQLDPAGKSLLKTKTLFTALTTVFSTHYLATRLVLFGAASAFIASNVFTAGGAFAVAPLLVPFLGAWATNAYRKSDFRQNLLAVAPQTADSLWLHGPVHGLMLGAAGAVAAAGLSGSMVPLESFAGFYAAFLTLFVGELHEIYFATNTNVGELGGLKTSPVDPVGANETKELVKDMQVRVVNPNTGLSDHSYGALGTALLARTVRLRSTCLFDSPIGGPSGAGGFNNDRKYLGWVTGMQKRIYSRLTQKFVFPGRPGFALAAQYGVMANNLRTTANYYDTELIDEIRRMAAANPTWFMRMETGAGYLNAFVEDLHARAQDMREEADRLQAQVQTAAMSQHDLLVNRRVLTLPFYPEPTSNSKIPIARKTLDGDDKKIRKTEGVATNEPQRGLTCYKSWTVGYEYSSQSWTPGTWSTILNPYYDPSAPDHMMQSSAYLLVKTDLLLTDLQRDNERFLSNSRIIEKIDNTPEAGEGFQSGRGDVTLRINGRPQTLGAGSYYFFPSTPEQPLIYPRAKRLIYREETGLNDAPAGYIPEGIHIATINETPSEAAMLGPIVFTPPAYDNTIMEDKNDIEHTSYLTEGAILERERQEKFVRAAYRQSVEGEFNFANPHPDKKLDLRWGISVIDADTEMVCNINGQDRTCPYGVSRVAAYTGYQTVDAQGVPIYNADGDPAVIDLKKADWKYLKTAVATLGQKSDGTRAITGFAFVYSAPKNAFQYFMARKITVAASPDLLDFCEENAAKYSYDAATGELTVRGKMQPKEQASLLKACAAQTDKDAIVALAKLSEKPQASMEMRVAVPQQGWPRYFGFKPEEVNQNEVVYSMNVFTSNPQRDGDMSWVRFYYQDGTVAFVKCQDGKRPMLFNKDLYADKGPGGKAVKPAQSPLDVPAADQPPADRLPTYYKVQVSQDHKNIKIYDMHTPMAVAMFIPRGWDRGLVGRNKVISIRKNEQNHGHMVGQGMVYDAQGRLVRTVPWIDLGTYQVLDRVAHLEKVVEIVPIDNKPGKWEVVERTLATEGLSVDRSKYIYTVDAAIAKRIKAEIPNLSWITDIQIDPERNVTVRYQPAVEGAAVVKTLSFQIQAHELTDNEGVSLCCNKGQGMGEVSNLYQTRTATAETRRFMPRLDEYNGAMRLVVHRVERREIDFALTEDQVERMKLGKGETVKIFPAAPDYVATIKAENGLEKEVYLTTNEPFDVTEADWRFSEVMEGQVQSAVGPQARFGETNNISGQYPRDKYFYGYASEDQAKRSRKQTATGALGGFVQLLNFALNRQKGIRGSGIQSGRTHMMNWSLVQWVFSDVMESNNPYLRKFSEYAEELFGPGVSEDTQGDISKRMKGLKMWVVKEMGALMMAEFDYGTYSKQNTERYNYSEALFMYAATLARIEALEAMMGNKGNMPFSWPQIFEVFAGRFWYKWAFAEEVRMMSIPLFLGSMGYVVAYPVDLKYFMVAWALHMVPSMVNYMLQLFSIGLGFVTGLWRNPVLELSFFLSYKKTAGNQHLYRNQFADFKMTNSGSGNFVPPENIRAIKRRAVATVGSLGMAGAILALNWSWPMLVLPLALAAIPVGISFLTKSFQPQSIDSKALRVLSRVGKLLGGAALLGVGGALTGALFPILFANPISLALVANIGFGLYQAAKLWAGVARMGLANQEVGAPKPEGNFFVQTGTVLAGQKVKGKMLPRAKGLEEFVAESQGKYRYSETKGALMIKGEMTPVELSELLAMYPAEAHQNEINNLYLQSNLFSAQQLERIEAFAAASNGRYKFDLETRTLYVAANVGLTTLTDVANEKASLAALFTDADGDKMALKGQILDDLIWGLEHTLKLHVAIPVDLGKAKNVQDFARQNRDNYIYDNRGFLMAVSGHVVTQAERDAIAIALTDKPEVKGKGMAILNALQSGSEKGISRQEFGSVGEVEAAHARFLDAKVRVRQNVEAYMGGHVTPSNSLTGLVAIREQMQRVLMGLGAMTKDAMYYQGIGHPYRILSHEMIRAYSALEMQLTNRALEVLSTDPTNVDAVTAITTIVDETNEREVLRVARAGIIRHGVKLPVKPRMKLLKGYWDLFVS